jgi:hypothetical protein
MTQTPVMARDVTAAVVRNRVDAQLMVAMLRDHGVPAWVSTDDAGGVEAALTMQGVRIMVTPEHAEQARELVGDEPAGPVKLNAFQRLVVRLLGGGNTDETV